MTQNYEFWLSKINELERKVFELEKKVNTLKGVREPRRTTRIDDDPHGEHRINTRIERYKFDGEVYKKSRLVLAVIKKYIETHPGITLDELNRAFPQHEFRCPFPCVMNVDNVTGRLLTPVKRYFVDEPITLSDGTNIAVCTQWGLNTRLFIDYVTENYGFEIEPTTLY